MTYWLLTTEFPPFYGGGISTYCYHTACMLSQKKHTVSVFVADPSLNVKVENEKRNDYRIIRFNPFLVCHHKELGHQARINYAFALLVEEFLRNEGNPDYVEAQDYLGIGYYVQQFKLLKYPLFENLSIIITIHSPAFIYLEHNEVSTYKYPDYWTCEMEKQSIISADLLISPSEFMATEIKKYLVNLPPIQVIPNPFDYNFPAELPRVKNNSFAFLGKLTRQKGVFHLLQTMESIWNKRKEITLTLIGSTDIVYHPELKTGGELVRRKYKNFIKSKNLIIAGKSTQKQIEALIKGAEAVIIPSIIDNLPYAVLEAMAQGKLVITTTSGGQSEVIRNEIDGFLYNYAIDGSLSQTIKKVQNLNEKEYKTICTNAINRIQTRYSYDTIYSEKINTLQQFQPVPKRNFPFLSQENYVPIEVKDSNEFLSVVIPFFNMSKTIDETIESVLKSTWPKTEVLLVNDGSTQKESLDKIEKYRNHSKIKVIDTENNGLSAARNTGAQFAKGSYLTFLDADDKVAPTYYEKAIRVLKNYNNVFFVGAWTQYFENSTATWPTIHPLPPLLLFHNTMNSSALVYKKESFLYSGLNDSVLKDGLEDYESVLHLVSNGYNGVVMPEILFFYRVRKDSMFRKLNHTKKRSALEYIITVHSEFYSKFAAAIIKLQIQNGPGFYYDNPAIEYKTRFTLHSSGKILKIAKRFAARYPILKKTGLAIYKRLKNN
ncbi:glycosyltransferase [Lacibacter sp. H375]|uniref:glycosyltransferase n=1 Tax=Lacibacter sp. H375 TaxID=3133424 RepID=UPI0030C0D79E